MRVGLFIPCYVDQFYPRVAKATLSVLEKLGYDVAYPLDQTCCGQPLANSGFESAAVDVSRLFLDNFDGFEKVVCPSGSCVLHAKEHVATASAAPELHEALIEFSSFVEKRIGVRALKPYRANVAIHQSCHGLRGLRLGRGTELMMPDFGVVRALLGRIPELNLVSLQRTDECCGFGGTFAVKEEAISVRMGEDRLDDHEQAGAELVTGTDVSCLMHLEGLARRRGRKLRFAHVSEILDEALQ